MANTNGLGMLRPRDRSSIEFRLAERTIQRRVDDIVRLWDIGT
jgi:hypothetical protein